MFIHLNVDSRRYKPPSSPTMGGFFNNRGGSLTVNVAFLEKLTMSKMIRSLIVLAVATISGALVAAPVGTPPAGEIAIRVDDLTIDANEFEGIFAAAVRHKYYHGQVPAEELKRFRQKVAQDIVIQVVVHRDAERNGLQPGRENIAREIEKYDAKYSNSPAWQAQREQVIPQLALRMERQNLLEKMEAKVKRLPEPGSQQVRAYYRANPDKFTEPERLRSAVILLPVPPSAGEEAWFATEVRARQLRSRIDNGEEFAVLAKQYSGHPSAVNGGDLGYLHQGILEPEVQQQVDALEIGAITDPIRVLDGIVLFRLNGVQPSRLMSFAEVQQRAAGLLYREIQDQAWRNYIRELKTGADIYVNENLYVQNDHE